MCLSLILVVAFTECQYNLYKEQRAATWYPSLPDSLWDGHVHYPSAPHSPWAYHSTLNVLDVYWKNDNVAFICSLVSNPDEVVVVNLRKDNQLELEHSPFVMYLLPYGFYVVDRTYGDTIVLEARGSEAACYQLAEAYSVGDIYQELLRSEASEPYISNSRRLS